jgi:hypothetical protein
MTPINFVYWLQGYFELRESTGAVLPVRFFATVQAHIDMCKATPGRFNPELVGFLGWMESAIEFNASAEAIQRKLHGLFEHVIDPMTVDVEVAENQSSAHGSGMFGAPGMRC